MKTKTRAKANGPCKRRSAHEGKPMGHLWTTKVKRTVGKQQVIDIRCSWCGTLQR